jgi:hypothetical protein
MNTPRIIPASAIRPGRATIVVSLPGRTIRSRVFMVELRHGVVHIAFTSGDMITLMARSAVGCIEPPPARTRRRAS